MDIFITILIIVVGVILLFKLIGFRIIPNNKIAIVEKWWSPKGSLNEQIIALNGEAGFQPQIIRGGIHFLSPLMYKVHICSLVTVPQGQIAYVFARDGKPLAPHPDAGQGHTGEQQFPGRKGIFGARRTKRGLNEGSSVRARTPSTLRSSSSSPKQKYISCRWATALKNRLL